MADLVPAEKEEDNNVQLDEHEVQILKKAKILSDKAGSFGKKRKHLLFAENVDEGILRPYSLPCALLTWESSDPTYQKGQRQGGISCCGSDVLKFCGRDRPWLENGRTQDQVKTENDGGSR